MFTSIAGRSLVVTGGSDFHGPIKPGINHGGAPVMPPVPYKCLTKLKERLDQL